MKSLICVRIFVNPWNVSYHGPASMGFSRKEYSTGLPFPSPEDLPNPGIKPGSPASQADSLLYELQGSPRARKVMPKAYQRFCLKDLSKFLPSQGLPNSLRFLYPLLR